MKTSGTLQSIRSIAGSKSADESRVRFNRFTGKAIVMGSSGSRFGLVSWVRKLYTTSSDKKIQKFLMDGIAKEHKDTVGLGISLRGKLASGTLQLRTVKDLKLWNKKDQSFIGQKGGPNVTEVLNKVAILMGEFNETPDKFVQTVSVFQYLDFRSLSNLQKRADACEQPSTESGGRVKQTEVPKGSRLYDLFPKYNKSVYHIAVLKSVQKSLQSQDMPLSGIPSDLSAYVGSIYTKTVAASHKNAVTAEAVAKDCFHQWLNGKFIDECKECATALNSFALQDTGAELICIAEGDETSSYKNDLGTRVRGLLDTNYSTKEGEAPSEEVKGKALFHEELRKDGALRKEIETVLKTTYLEYNTNFGKTIYSANFLNRLSSQRGNQKQRGQALDEALLNELNLQYRVYCKNKGKNGTGGIL